ncbi:dioxygenase [Piscinibacter sp. XHJ-5]|uniref:dioxygenase family protein n=1 Tax=Piscinibacter sp. XHJ-5 TaxID=3037797 RepID=UPI0024533C04|nr:dioxygenase [Piscinibacter sp. XHJ-5]
MRNIDEHTITGAVLESLEGCDDPRLKQILGALVTHLHDFVREVQLTEDEWLQGIRFLTATGQMCSDTRQEFILLSDTLGVSMLTVALNRKQSAAATEATVFGPFHVDDAPRLEQGCDIAAGAPGRPLDVDVVVRSSDGTPLPGAEVDVWQADEEGLYDVQRGPHRRARAVMKTDAEGRLRFRAIVPTAYPVPTDGPVGRMLVASGRHPWRPAHIHFLIKADGHETLTTHLFRDGDPYLDSDVVFGVRRSLVVEMGDTLTHTFVLDRS